MWMHCSFAAGSRPLLGLYKYISIYIYIVTYRIRIRYCACISNFLLNQPFRNTKNSSFRLLIDKSELHHGAQYLDSFSKCRLFSRVFSDTKLSTLIDKVVWRFIGCVLISMRKAYDRTNARIELSLWVEHETERRLYIQQAIANFWVICKIMRYEISIYVPYMYVCVDMQHNHFDNNKTHVQVP